jgi:hypothetical protein
VVSRAESSNARRQGSHQAKSGCSGDAGRAEDATGSGRQRRTDLDDRARQVRCVECDVDLAIGIAGRVPRDGERLALAGRKDGAGRGIRVELGRRASCQDQREAAEARVISHPSLDLCPRSVSMQPDASIRLGALGQRQRFRLTLPRLVPSRPTGDGG